MPFILERRAGEQRSRLTAWDRRTHRDGCDVGRLHLWRPATTWPGTRAKRGSLRL